MLTVSIQQVESLSSWAESEHISSSSSILLPQSWPDHCDASTPHKAVFIIFSGWIPIGYIKARLVKSHQERQANGSLYELKLSQLRIASDFIHGISRGSFLSELSRIPSLFSDVLISTINLVLYDHLSDQKAVLKLLEGSSWTTLSNSHYAIFNPSQDLGKWQSYFNRLSQIYKRQSSDSSLQFVCFKRLRPSQRQLLEASKSPVWCRPFHSSLRSRSDSSHSYVALKDGSPVAWLLADSFDSCTLQIETIYYDTNKASSALVYALIFLSFGTFFGFKLNHPDRTFVFSYFESNTNMKQLHKWIKAFEVLNSKSTSLQLDVA